MLRPQGIVLLVNEDVAVRDMLRHALLAEGLLPVAAEDAGALLQLAGTLKPALIILETLTPKIDGWELLRALKADPALKPCPVVLLGGIEDRATARARGAADFLARPIDRHAVTRLLDRLGPLPALQTPLERAPVEAPRRGRMRAGARRGKLAPLYDA